MNGTVELRVITSHDADQLLLPHSHESYTAAGDVLPMATFTYVNDTNTTLNEPVNLIEILGPKRQELYKVIIISVVYVIIFITGVIGNVATCIVIAQNKFMQTATNYYLFNLAVADLLVLILGLPQELYSLYSAYPWIFGEAFCIIRGLTAETSTYASILTITAFTVERYVAICHPMRSGSMLVLSRAVKAIIFIWIFSGICSIPIVYQQGIEYIRDSYGNAVPGSAVCTAVRERRLEHAFEISTFLFFFTPMTLITILYIMIGIAIRRSSLSRAGSDSSTSSTSTGGSGVSCKGKVRRAPVPQRARRAVLKMLESYDSSSSPTIMYIFGDIVHYNARTLPLTVAVVVAFFICWAPFHAQRLLAIYVKTYTPELHAIHGVLFYISGVFYYFSCTINPILYNVMSLKFRQAFKNTILRPCRRRRKRPVAKTYKFHNRPIISDTSFTMVNGDSPDQKKNKNNLYLKHQAPLIGDSPEQNKIKNNVLLKHPVLEPKKDSSSSGSGMRMLSDDPFDGGPELEHMLAKLRTFSCGSFANNSDVGVNQRPYHSHA